MVTICGRWMPGDGAFSAAISRAPTVPISHPPPTSTFQPPTVVLSARVQPIVLFPVCIPDITQLSAFTYFRLPAVITQVCITAETRYNDGRPYFMAEHLRRMASRTSACLLSNWQRGTLVTLLTLIAGMRHDLASHKLSLHWTRQSAAHTGSFDFVGLHQEVVGGIFRRGATLNLDASFLVGEHPVPIRADGDIDLVSEPSDSNDDEKSTDEAATVVCSQQPPHQ